MAEEAYFSEAHPLHIVLTVFLRTTRPFHDRVCKTWTECGQGEYEVLAPTAFEDRVCEDNTECDVSVGRDGLSPVAHGQ